jgi:hypothetical protein
MFVSPRLDLVVGVPAFSRKIAIFAGTGFVPVAPLLTGENEYTYIWLFTKKENRPTEWKNLGEALPHFVDASVGIRFYPF